MRILQVALLAVLATACAHIDPPDDRESIVRVAAGELAGQGRLVLSADLRLPSEARAAVERAGHRSASNAAGGATVWLRVEELTIDRDFARFQATRRTRDDCGTTYILLLERHDGRWTVVSNRVVGECEAAT